LSMLRLKRLFASWHHIGQLATASGAKYVVLVLDEGKKKEVEISLLEKHRKWTQPDKHDLSKLSSFLKHCQDNSGNGGQSASKTSGEAARAVNGIVAELLHRTEEGQGLIRLLAVKSGDEA
jgi:hypothetical protein